MAIYRFRICFEEDEEIVRVIEVKSNQTFEDLHFAILKSIEFDTKHNAVLYLSDDYWKKGKKFIFLPEGNEEVPLFSSAKLSSVIYDPHQKFLYVYDLSQEWTFLIELVGISIKEDSKTSYPHIVRTEGKAPKQYVVQRKIGPDLEDDEFEYLTKNLLSGEIAEELSAEHLDEAEIPEDVLEEGEDDIVEETEAEEEVEGEADIEEDNEIDSDLFPEGGDDDAR